MRQYKGMQLTVFAKFSEDSKLDLPLRFQKMDTRCQKDNLSLCGIQTRNP